MFIETKSACILFCQTVRNLKVYSRVKKNCQFVVLSNAKIQKGSLHFINSLKLHWHSLQFCLKRVFIHISGIASKWRRLEQIMSLLCSDDAPRGKGKRNENFLYNAIGDRMSDRCNCIMPPILVSIKVLGIFLFTRPADCTDIFY